MEKKPIMEERRKETGSSIEDDGKIEDDLMFPGFRFHPTDQELVGFYLKRKVERKGFSIDIIKETDVYKHDPWDLPSEAVQQGAGEREWYFFCLRGRKYRNSIRPNRVTGSGFWKATGIDKPIHDGAGAGECVVVGLKKSLVYYRGSAGKGTKTDWMMHEFRLPSAPSSAEGNMDDLPDLQEEPVVQQEVPAAEARRKTKPPAAAETVILRIPATLVHRLRFHGHQLDDGRERGFSPPLPASVPTPRFPRRHGTTTGRDRDVISISVSLERADELRQQWRRQHLG